MCFSWPRSNRTRTEEDDVLKAYVVDAGHSRVIASGPLLPWYTQATCGDQVRTVVAQRDNWRLPVAVSCLRARNVHTCYPRYTSGMQAPSTDESGSSRGAGGSGSRSSGGFVWPEAWQRLARQLAASLDAIMQRRYAELQIRDALGRRSDYVEACKELAALLKGAYTKVPKMVQAALFDDVLVAFRALPSLDTSRELSAANALLLAAESALPKQRRFTAANEYKHAAIAQSRRCKRQQEEVSDHVPLPHDVLVQVFGFLDASGLAAARAVCRDWRAAATDDSLWRSMYLFLLATSTDREVDFQIPAGVAGIAPPTPGTWLKTFEAGRKASPHSLFLSNRAYCLNCNCVLWMSELPWKRESKPGCNRGAGQHEQHRLRPLTPEQVLRYIVKDQPGATSSLGSGSDTEDEDEDGEDRGSPSANRFFRLWAHPRIQGDDFFQP